MTTTRNGGMKAARVVRPWVLARLVAWLRGRPMSRLARCDEAGIEVAGGADLIISMPDLAAEPVMVEKGYYWATVTMLAADGRRAIIPFVGKADAVHFSNFAKSTRVRVFNRDVRPWLDPVLLAAGNLKQQLLELGYLNARSFVNFVSMTDTSAVDGGVKIIRRWAAATSKDARQAANLLHSLRTSPEDVRNWGNKLYMERAIKGPLDASLTDAQKRAVVTEEDCTLVLAGAGSGKTKVIVARVQHLLRRGVKPDEILAVTFNRDAAKVVRERLRTQGLPAIEVRTFHSLGRSVLKAAQYDIDDNDDVEVPSPSTEVSQLALDEERLDEHLTGILSELYADPTYRVLITDYFSSSFHDYRDVATFNSEGEYLEYLASQKLVSLAGHRVRSFEECAISNFLYLHGVEHDYERPYPQNVSGRGRKWYKPDFYLPGHDIWIEHYCFTDEEATRTPPFIRAEAYKRSFEWKRNLHAKQRNRYVETFSWQMRQGVLFKQLRKTLENNYGVVFAPIPFEYLFARVNETLKRNAFAELLRTFLGQAKVSEFSSSALRARVGITADPQRAAAFLRIYEAVRKVYDERLAANKEIDFADMITQARHCVERGLYRKRFAHILVDEFQDIARGRARLIHAIAKRHPDCRLFFVGDDWQSINRFAGSDLDIMRRVEHHFESTTQRCELDRTFRFNDRIGAVAKKFIMTNRNQFEKTVDSTSRVHEPAILSCREVPGSDDALATALEEMASRARSLPGFGTPGWKASVLVLARYGWREPEALLRTWANHPQLESSFKTVHASKGMEADFVAVIGLSSAPGGAFPSSHPEDSLMRMVLPARETFPDAEERRLFYVALTRAKHAVWLLAEDGAPSPFVLEVERYGADLVQCRHVDRAVLLCPHCKTGLLRPRRGGVDKNAANEGGGADKSSAPGGYFCTMHRYCEAWVPTCPEGHVASVGWDPAAQAHRCAVDGCRSGPLTCPDCNAPVGRRERRDNGAPYAACTQYPHCRHTRDLGWQNGSGRQAVRRKN